MGPGQASEKALAQKLHLFYARVTSITSLKAGYGCSGVNNLTKIPSSNGSTSNFFTIIDNLENLKRDVTKYLERPVLDKVLK